MVEGTKAQAVLIATRLQTAVERLHTTKREMEIWFNYK